MESLFPALTQQKLIRHFSRSNTLMKKIGIISDTHLSRPTDDFKSTLARYFDDVEIIIHAGDMTGRPTYDFLSKWDLRAVAGNMDDYDLSALLPDKRIEEIEGWKIGITHGRGSPFWLEKFVLSAFENVDIIIFGHSHIPLSTKRGNIHLFNPGSYKSTRTLGVLELGDRVSFNFIGLE